MVVDPIFGGAWTEKKLDVLRSYLVAYATALKKQGFHLTYIDGFAGSGRRDARESKEVLDGSARIALAVAPPFQRYVFIEQRPAYAVGLEELRLEYPSRDIEVLVGNANEEIQRLCASSWAGRRAALFLDPFGMQVEWKTIEAIAATQSIDM